MSNLDDLLGNSGGQLGLIRVRSSGSVFQAGLAELPVLCDPSIERSNRDVQLRADRVASKALLQEKLHRS